MNNFVNYLNVCARSRGVQKLSRAGLAHAVIGGALGGVRSVPCSMRLLSVKKRYVLYFSAMSERLDACLSLMYFMMDSYSVHIQCFLHSSRKPHYSYILTDSQHFTGMYKALNS